MSHGRWPERLVIAAIAFLVMAGLLTQVWIPRLIENRVIGAVRENCPRCRLEVGRVSYLLTGRIRLRGIEFHASAHEGRVALDARIEEVQAEVSFFDLLSGALRVHDVRVLSPEVVLLERDRERLLGRVVRGPREQAGSAVPALPLPEFAVFGIQIERGHFQYLHESAPARLSKLSLDSISMRLDPFGTAPELLNNPVNGTASGILNGSGLLTVSGSVNPFSWSQNTTLDLVLSDPQLSSLNAFLVPETGATVSGQLTHAQAKMRITRGVLSGGLSLSYVGFRISFADPHDRGAFQTLVADLGPNLKVNESEIPRSKRDRERSLRGMKKESESVFKLMIRALRNAALEVVTS